MLESLILYGIMLVSNIAFTKHAFRWFKTLYDLHRTHPIVPNMEDNVSYDLVLSFNDLTLRAFSRINSILIYLC